MANSNGYVVLRQAVSASVASKLADDFQNGLIHNVPTATKDKYNEYKVPQTGFEIKDEFLRHSLTDQNMDKDLVAPLFYPNQTPSSPQTLNLGMFHETDADPTKLMTAGPRIYVTIAITRLSPSNGWFTFYEGSHQHRSRLGRKVALDLEAGDAVAWRGDLVYFHSPGGGGIFLVLSFPMGSDD
ncbi:hypothetical protein N7524_003799 [Penicillium chrysogenum]|nr:hypothetical protein N7524_003799 [Penicillium chrysogenum]